MPHYVNGKSIPVIGDDVDNIKALNIKTLNEPKKEAPKATVKADVPKPKKSATKKGKKNAKL